MGQFDNLFKELDKNEPQEKQKNKKPNTTAKTNIRNKPQQKNNELDANNSVVNIKEKKTTTETNSQNISKGKSSNPDYKQVLTYLKKDTHRLAKIALLNETENRDLSDLVESLVYEWLEKT